MNRNLHRVLGITAWLAILVGAYFASTKAGSATDGVSLASYFAGPTDEVQVSDPLGRLQVHDPIFYQNDSGTWQQIGFVQSVSQSNELVISWHSRDVAPGQCSLVQYRNSGRLEDVIATMLPPEKRLQIQQRLAAAMSSHGQELSASFAPLVRASLQRSLPVIEEELRKTVDRHRDAIDQLAGRWNDQVVRERLIPLAKREILPIVKTHGEPTVEVIGRELWDRASLWRFGWRAIYDKTPLPRKDLLQEEWDRFVEKEAVPIFESHMDDVVVAVQKIVVDVTANQTVRRELGAVASDIAADPEARQLVRVILKETLIDNERLKEVWSSVWTSDDARAALDMAGDRLEPVVRSIGDDLFGTREEGITPSFARVLRNQILGKDRRWIVATKMDVDVGSQSQTKLTQPTIPLSPIAIPYPIIYTAENTKGGFGE